MREKSKTLMICNDESLANVATQFKEFIKDHEKTPKEMKRMAGMTGYCSK